MDARKKKVLLVLCLASPILLWRMYALLTEHLPSQASADPASLAVDFDTAGQTADHSQRRDEMARVWKEQDAVANQAWGRDPFAEVQYAAREAEPIEVEEAAPADGPPPQAPAIVFTGISKSDDKWLAVVQGNIVGVGDVIEETYRVIEITTGSITLGFDGWAFEYMLGQSEAVARRRSGVP